MQDELITLRQQINLIDEELVELFERRMEIVLKVAEYKRKNNLEIFDEKRENEVKRIRKEQLKNKSFEDALEKFLDSLMSISRELQK